MLTFNSRGDETHIGINADKSQLNIDSVWVNGHPAEFEHDQCVGFGTQSSVANEQQRHYQLSSPPFDLRDARTRELERARLADRGELLVKLPLALRGIEKGELRVEIQYRLKPSRPGVARTGIHFVSGGGGASASASVYAERPRSAYTVTGRYGRTSSWLPCVEGSFSTFEIAILCDERYGACGAVAVGRRMDNTTEGEGLPAENRAGLRRHRFFSQEVIQPRDVGFAVGHFDEDDANRTRAQDARESLAVPLEVLVPWDPIHTTSSRSRRQRRRDIVQHTCACVTDMLKNYDEYCRKYAGDTAAAFPFATFRLVFLHECPREGLEFAGMAFVPRSCLHTPRDIDAAFEWRKRAALSVARAWFGAVVKPQRLADEWLVDGLVGILSDRYLTGVLGKNEVDWDLYECRRRLCDAVDPSYPQFNVKDAIARGTFEKLARTVHPALPLTFDGFCSRSELEVGSRVDKARVVFHTLEAMIGAQTLQGVARSRLIGAKGASNTKKFLKRVKKALPAEKKNAYMQYETHIIHGVSFPRLRAQFEFMRKMKSTRITFDQDKRTPDEANVARHSMLREASDAAAAAGSGTPQREYGGSRKRSRSPARGGSRRSPSKRPRSENSPRRKSSARRKGVSPRRGGALPERSVEDFSTSDGRVGTNLKLDGTVSVIVHEIGRRFIRKQQINDAKDTLTIECKSEQQRNHTRRKGNTLEDRLHRQAASPVKYIVVDQDQQWIRPVDVYQTGIMWTYQLLESRNAMCQLAALNGFCALESPEGDLASEDMARIVPAAMLKVLKDSAYFWRVRAKAARGLALTFRHKFGKANVEKLSGYFETLYKDSASRAWRRNNFSNVAEYFLKKSMVKALAQARDKTNSTPIKVIKLSVDLLKHNDNSMNNFSDSEYLACLVESLGGVRMSDTVSDMESPNIIWEQILRFLKRDQIMPSYRNTLTRACLSAICGLCLSGIFPTTDQTSEFGSVRLRGGVCPVDPRRFAEYENYEEVREAAYHALVRLLPVSKLSWSAADVIDIVMKDPVVAVRRAALTQWASAWEAQAGTLRAHASDTKFQKGLWYVVNDDPDGRVRCAARRVYRSVWGDQDHVSVQGLLKLAKRERSWTRDLGKAQFPAKTRWKEAIGKVLKDVNKLRDDRGVKMLLGSARI